MGKKIYWFLNSMKENFGQMAEIYGSMPSALYGDVETKMIKMPDIAKPRRIKSVKLALKEDMIVVSNDLYAVTDRQKNQHS